MLKLKPSEGSAPVRKKGFKLVFELIMTFINVIVCQNLMFYGCFVHHLTKTNFEFQFFLEFCLLSFERLEVGFFGYQNSYISICLCDLFENWYIQTSGLFIDM